MPGQEMASPRQGKVRGSKKTVEELEEGEEDRQGGGERHFLSNDDRLTANKNIKKKK